MDLEYNYPLYHELQLFDQEIIPLLPDQRNQLRFTSREQQDAFFEKRKRPFFEGENFSFISPSSNYIKVEMKFTDTANRYNSIISCTYMRFRNAKRNNWDTDYQRWFYAFILNIDYVNPNVIGITYKIDVFQTYYFDVVYGSADIERCTPTMDRSLRTPSINVIPEGIEYGSSYVHKEYEFPVRGASNSRRPYLIVSTARLYNVTPKDSDGNPRIAAATGGTLNYLPTACDYYIVNWGGNDQVTIQTFIGTLSQYPWLSQNIIGVYVFPDIFIDAPNVGTFNDVNFLDTGWKMKHYFGGGVSTVRKSMKSIYENFPDYQFGKLFNYPYSYYELVSPDGQTRILKPELFGDPSAEQRLEFSFVCNPVPTVVCKPMGYLGFSDMHGSTVAAGAFATFPVQNNQYLAARTSAENIHNLIRNQNMTNLDIGKQYALQNLQIDQTQRAINGGVGVASSLLSLNIGGALQQGVNTAFEMERADRLTGQSLEQVRRLEDQRAALSRAQIDNNQSPISLSGSTGPGITNLLTAQDNFSFYLRCWTIKYEQYRTRLQNYFGMYGYRENYVVKKFNPNAIVGRRFVYWKLNDLEVKANIPGTHLMEFRNIFLNGVWLWCNVEEDANFEAIGDCDYQTNYLDY